MHKAEFLTPDIRHPTRSRSVSPASLSRRYVYVASPSPTSPSSLLASSGGTTAPVCRDTAAPSPLLLTVSERKRMFEESRGGGGGGEKESLIPRPSSSSPAGGGDHADLGFSGKRRHSAKDRFSSRGSSFRSKKLRQEASTGDLGVHNTHNSPQTRHKQQASVSSITLPPLSQRLRNFGHHDLQSATLERYRTSKYGGEHSTRKKPTGASAAQAGGGAALETLRNDLLAVCPAFRNEIGGDADWMGVHKPANEGASILTSFRKSLSHDKQMRVCSRAKMILGGSVVADGGGGGGGGGRVHGQVLQIQQAQSSVHFPFEFIDYGALYYRNHFYLQEHQNLFGVDENNGPLAISLKRERVPDDVIGFFDVSPAVTGQQATPPKHQYRIIVRTSELETLRGTILEDSVPSGTKTGTSRGLPPREVIDYISQGEFHASCLKVGKQEKKVYQELMRLDEQELNNRYKIGILYCKSGQNNEEEMYNNECGSPAFEEFLNTIGQKVTMKGFNKYRAQLDHKTDTTGTHSIFTEYQGSEVMFHVSTYLPHTPSNSQQLLRKRHIGNDIVTVIFQEPGCAPFSPKVIRSHFQHIFLIVRVQNPATDYTKYRVAVTRTQDTPYFGPPIPEGGVFDKNEHFREFFLTKLINACNASLRSEKFATMATRTRRQYLLDLCENSSTVTIDQAATSGLVGLLSKNWGGKKKEKPYLQASLVYTPGALVWNVAVILKDGRPLPFSVEQNTTMDCLLILAADLLVIVYNNTRESILHIPTKDISGWAQDGKRINLFYDGTHCLSLETYETEDSREIMFRLQTLAPCLTASHEATLMEFQRSQGALLGFSINEVCEVLTVSGKARQTGLQIKSRILQVEDKLVCCHKHTHIVDILTDRMKTNVRAYVIPPAPERRRPLLHYPPVNWQGVWSNRPMHMNGESDDPSPQNGTETSQMETEPSSFTSSSIGAGGGGGGSVALRGKKRPATVHGVKAHRSSYHEALKMDELTTTPREESQTPVDDDEPIYDRLRTTTGGGVSPTNIPLPQLHRHQRARSPKPVRGDNTGFARVRGRGPGGGREHMPAQQIAENIRATERALSAGPSPEPVDYRVENIASQVTTHISTSTHLPHSQPHTAQPLSSLRTNSNTSTSSRKSDKVMIEILDPAKSPPPTASSTSGCPPTPGSVQELAKKFSFSSPPPSNKSSPSRTSGSSLVGGAKTQATPMKATVAAQEMTRSGIPLPARQSPVRKFSPTFNEDVKMRGKPRSPKMRPASWDASLIYDGERELKESGRFSSREERGGGGGGGGGGKQFRRKENGRLPVRKKQPGQSGEEEEVERGESEEPLPSSNTEQLSQEEKVKISVRERTQKWEARGGELPSYFSTLPKSFRSKGGRGGGGGGGGGGGNSRPQSPNSPVSPGPGSRIPTPRSTASPQTALTQSLKAKNVYSKQSTPPIQEETDYQEEEHIYNRLSEKQPQSLPSDGRREKSPSPLTSSYPGGGRVGGASQMRGVAPQNRYGGGSGGGGGRVVGTRSLGSSISQVQLGGQRTISPPPQLGGQRAGGRGVSPVRSTSPPTRGLSPPTRGMSPPNRGLSPPHAPPHSQLMSPTRRTTSPVARTTSPTRRTVVLAARSPSPTSGVSKIPPPSSSTTRHSNRSPPHQLGGQGSSRNSRENPLDTVVLESALTSLKLSESRQLSSRETSTRKVEDWLRKSSSAGITTTTPVSTEMTGKHEGGGGGGGGVVRMDQHQYRKNSYSRNSVKTAMI